MKAILYIFLLTGALYGATVVVPDNVQDRALATIGLADFSATETIKNTATQAKDTVTDTFIPKSPQERRAERIERLQSSLEEIRRAQATYQANPTPEAQQEVEEVVTNTEKALAALEEENNKEKEGAVSAVLHATADGIRKVTGTQEPLQCEPIEE